MSVGKFRSSCEDDKFCTSAEIWMLAKTAIELFGASVSKFANKFTSCGIDSSLIIDMTTKPDDGQFWDLGTSEDQDKLDRMQQEPQTELLNGSAPCISFRTLLPPSEKGTKKQTETAQDEQRQHTHKRAAQHERQLRMGRHFLHEHPVHASRWCMPEMPELLSDGRIHLVLGPMCRWRMTVTVECEQGFVHGKARWATLLAREQAGENRRDSTASEHVLSDCAGGGQHFLRHISTVQNVIGLSSAESGHYALTQGGCSGLGLQSLLTDWNLKQPLSLHTDSSSAKAVASRRGAGKSTRHIQTRMLWPQELAAAKHLRIVKSGNGIKSCRHVDEST